jgi:hypothetical protein
MWNRMNSSTVNHANSRPNKTRSCFVPEWIYLPKLDGSIWTAEPVFFKTILRGRRVGLRLSHWRRPPAHAYVNTSRTTIHPVLCEHFSVFSSRNESSSVWTWLEPGKFEYGSQFTQPCVNVDFMAKPYQNICILKIVVPICPNAFLA